MWYTPPAKKMFPSLETCNTEITSLVVIDSVVVLDGILMKAER